VTAGAHKGQRDGNLLPAGGNVGVSRARMSVGGSAPTGVVTVSRGKALAVSLGFGPPIARSLAAKLPCSKRTPQRECPPPPHTHTHPTHPPTHTHIDTHTHTHTHTSETAFFVLFALLLAELQEMPFGAPLRACLEEEEEAVALHGKKGQNDDEGRVLPARATPRAQDVTTAQAS
jgi:hypothetical protein